MTTREDIRTLIAGLSVLQEKLTEDADFNLLAAVSNTLWEYYDSLLESSAKPKTTIEADISSIKDLLKNYEMNL